MKKHVCFLTAFCLVFLLAVTVNAEGVKTSLSVRESGSKSVYVDAFIDSESSICGGMFTLSFDDDFAIFSSIESDVFDVDAYENNGNVKVIVANEKCEKLSEGEPVFTVKLSTSGKEDFSVTLNTEYILNDNFEKVLLKNETATAIVERNSVSVPVEVKKEKSDINIEKDKSSINKKSDFDVSTDDSSFLPINVDGKGKGFGLILAVGILVVTAFLFGLFFRKYMENKDIED